MGIGGLTILLHMSGTNHSDQDAHFPKGANGLRTGKLKSALARVVAPGQAMAECPNSDAKLVDCHAVGNELGGLPIFPKEEVPRNSTKANRQSFRAFNPAIVGIKRYYASIVFSVFGEVSGINQSFKPN